MWEHQEIDEHGAYLDEVEQDSAAEAALDETPEAKARRLEQELADVLEIAIMRGEEWDADDSDYVARLRELRPYSRVFPKPDSHEPQEVA